jgi:hypothetical protein
LIVNRNITNIHVVDAHVIAGLRDRRILLDVLHVRLFSAIKPAVAHADLPDDGNSARRPAADGYIAGVREYFEVGCAAHGESLFKVPLLGCNCQGRPNQQTQNCCHRLRESWTHMRSPREIIHSATTPLES